MRILGRYVVYSDMELDLSAGDSDECDNLVVPVEPAEPANPDMGSMA
ncbi:MAG: hypothetical protein MRZ28_08415 [Oscillospiraceae bacterium]|nr:hypothetical protein [Oscillospiraceae bacterium]MDY3218153.1 hypothetical protein [Candidatus Fimivivens sp.]